MLFHSPSNLFLVAHPYSPFFRGEWIPFPFSKQPVFGCHPYSSLSWRMDAFPFSKQPVFGCLILINIPFGLPVIGSIFTPAGHPAGGGFLDPPFPLDFDLPASFPAASCSELRLLLRGWRSRSPTSQHILNIH